MYVFSGYGADVVGGGIASGLNVPTGDQAGGGVASGLPSVPTGGGSQPAAPASSNDPGEPAAPAAEGSKTMLYLGIGALALVGYGLLKKKRRRRR